MLILPPSHLTIMSKKLLILPVLLSALYAGTYAQVKLVNAYKQASIPGIIIGSEENDIVEKSGAKKRDQKQTFNYWFYLSIPKKEKVTITGLWIDGKQYEIKSDNITDLPVKKIIYTGVEKNDTIVMVPASSNNIILVYPGGIKSAGTKLKLAATNELVIRYTWKGNIRYASTRRIKMLAPDVRV